MADENEYSESPPSVPVSVKHPLYVICCQKTRSTRLGSHPVIVALFTIVTLGIYCYFCSWSWEGEDTTWLRAKVAASTSRFAWTPSHACPQAEELTPKKHLRLWESLNEEIGGAEFEKRAIEWLGGAVRIPTETVDDMGLVGVDPRWDVFKPFFGYLSRSFPLTHANLNLTKVNTYGLLFEWKGSNMALKPILLAAHQDVVPVDPATKVEWEYPPYSGHFDGQRLWGRGSLDDKNGLIGILSDVETLIASNFQPTRTVVLAFGFDEESRGLEGAGHLGPFLLDLYGENAFAMIVDEGSPFTEQYGSVIATPGIAEMGYLDVFVDVTSPGGHSSIPPEHTSIGILSALLVHYEQNHYQVELTRHEPVYDMLQCIAEHGKSVPSHLRKVIKESARSDLALRELTLIISQDKVLKNLVRTTQAIDMIQGGVKSNALPERAWAIVDHRIAVLSSVDEVKQRDAHLLKPLSEKFNLNYSAFGNLLTEEGASASGSLVLSDAFHSKLEPAPVTPTSKDAAPYQLLSGTIKATYNAHRSLTDSKDSIIVAPALISGNTDTQFYWKLSRDIFRYNHHSAPGGKDNPLSGIHTVNEFITSDAFVEMIRFFVTLILNADESTAF